MNLIRFTCIAHYYCHWQTKRQHVDTFMPGSSLAIFHASQNGTIKGKCAVEKLLLETPSDSQTTTSYSMKNLRQLFKR